MGCLSWMQLSYVTFTHSADVEVQPPPAAGGTLVDDQRGTARRSVNDIAIPLCAARGRSECGER